ncbi:MAG: hypothetical protein KGN34_07805 [Sphingomonadales bacterium]|nr:hypothetical protein [Sphingomonadales bacterium]
MHSKRLPISASDPASGASPHDRAAGLLALARARNVRLQQAALRDLICPPNPWEILLVLFCAPGPLALGEIAASLDSTPRQIARWVDALVNHHLVTRESPRAPATLTRCGIAIVEDSLAGG